jgi:phenylpropionate dioxygenase-like ring-hydroxylating dioxygenase large terminal subunit
MTQTVKVGEDEPRTSKFAQNAWYVAGWSHEISSKPLARRICNVPIVLYRELDGSAAALLDACVHRGAPLSLGTVEDRGIRCNYHGMIFDRGGVCVHIPAQDAISPKARVRSFATVEKDSLVWLWLGNPDEAKPDEIVDYPFHNDFKAWPHRSGVMHTNANYLLLVDNLVDVTHLSYVHQQTVGGQTPDIHFKAEMEFDRSARGIRIRRRMFDAPAPPAYNNCVEFSTNVDRWQDFDFFAPGSCIQYSGAVPAGESREAWQGARFDMRIFHAWTPETDDTTFYFWSVANGHDTGNPAATDALHEQIFSTLLEDKAIVEAEHSRISELGEDWMVDVRSDLPRVAMRRAIRRLIDGEGSVKPSAPVGKG